VAVEEDELARRVAPSTRFGWLVLLVACCAFWYFVLNVVTASADMPCEPMEVTMMTTAERYVCKEE